VGHKGRQSSVRARYGVGAGKHAVTYFADYNERLLELRLSYYPGVRRWDFSPGQQVRSISGGVLYPEGLVKTPDVVEGCFTCHTTGLVKDRGELRPEKAMLGVGCESCHGPGRDHIAAVRRGSKDLRMVDLGAIRGRLSVELCGQCHRSPAGEDVHDPFNRSQLPRLQGLALSQSACFTNSNGRLSCLTCHDAHGNATEPHPHYNAQCRSCHGASPETGRPCPIEPAGDCVSCHMPEQPVSMPTGLKYRNHWIKVW
jgi:hypothetical protein